VSRYYQGRYRVKNREKYIGDPDNIIYRSLWEFRVLRWLDSDPQVERFSSEEIVIPYLSPKDGKTHRYFPDFYFEKKDEEGHLQKYLVEVKPYEQTRAPSRGKKSSRRYIKEATTYAVNAAKWRAAEEFCLSRGVQFKILTERDLGDVVGKRV